jgi:hypothetical protein
VGAAAGWAGAAAAAAARGGDAASAQAVPELLAAMGLVPAGAAGDGCVQGPFGAPPGPWYT